MDRRLALGVAVLLAGSGLVGMGVGPAAAERTANAAPVAVADSYTTAEGQTLDPDTSVLANDTDADEDDLTATYVQGTGPSHGSVTFYDDGYFVYTPQEDYHGPDSFTYKANDDTVDSAPAKVSITVTAGPNTAPVAVADSYSIAENSELTQAAPGLLSNDTDAEGDKLAATMVTKPAHGGYKFASTGAFVYTPQAGFHGVDSFTYKVSDGDVDSAPAKVTIMVGSQTTPACAATVSIGTAPTVTEGNSGTRKMTFPVKASNIANCGALTVKLKVSGGTASKTSDYRAPGATLVLPAGKTAGSVSVTVKGDKKYEGTETVSLTLTSVSAASGSPKLGTSKATGKIRNDDKKP